MTPDELSEIEQRANVAKSVVGGDRLETHLAWVEDWNSTGHVVTDDAMSVPYALCVAEETAELVIHGPDDIDALVAEVRRLREVLQGLVPLPTSDDTTFTQQADYGSDAR